MNINVYGRFSYLNVFEPKAKSSNKPNELSYSTALIIPKSDKVNVDAILTAEKEVFVKKFGEKELKNGKIPSKYKRWVKDGDTEEDGERKYGKEAEGCYIINCSCKSQYRPAVIGGKSKAPITQEDIKSGDYGYLNVTVFAFSNEASGIAAQLNHVWKTKTGEALANVVTVDDAFKSADVENVEFDEEDDF